MMLLVILYLLPSYECIISKYVQYNKLMCTVQSLLGPLTRFSSLNAKSYQSLLILQFVPSQK